MAADIGHDYRRRIGQYLQEARLKAGLTQGEVAQHLGVWHSAISAFEVGRQALPPERYGEIADLYGLNRKKFGDFLLRYTNPWLYALIHGDAAVGDDLVKIPERVMDMRKDADAE